ncbi:hypothetical protein B0H63DRAFT_450280 [Podospora didyma]|uniref:Serine protease n=1 Tax=Podospora didyma TaxID=330526 RepID=A0AAE0TVH3_9PEZI|nr:hypothetical protein B0H63DRAFT_450280 [Podospora didyma]
MCVSWLSRKEAWDEDCGGRGWKFQIDKITEENTPGYRWLSMIIHTKRDMFEILDTFEKFQLAVADLDTFPGTKTNTKFGITNSTYIKQHLSSPELQFCWFVSREPNHSPWVERTGWLAGSNTVVTAAHNLLHPKYGRAVAIRAWVAYQHASVKKEEPIRSARRAPLSLVQNAPKKGEDRLTVTGYSEDYEGGTRRHYATSDRMKWETAGNRIEHLLDTGPGKGKSPAQMRTIPGTTTLVPIGRGGNDLKRFSQLLEDTNKNKLVAHEQM